MYTISSHSFSRSFDSPTHLPFLKWYIIIYEAQIENRFNKQEEIFRKSNENRSKLVNYKLSFELHSSMGSMYTVIHSIVYCKLQLYIVQYRWGDKI